MDLKGKTVFIDTSVFVGNNFLHGTVIKTFLNPDFKEDFNIVLTKITVNEIKTNFKRWAERAIEKHNQLINGKLKDEHNKNINVDVLKNVEESAALIQRMPKLNVLCKSFGDNLDKMLDAVGAKILDYPILDTKNVFDAYFAGTPPFGLANKKSEFPDAIALAQIEKYASEIGENILVFSNDGDFFKVKSEHITSIKEYKIYIDELLGEKRRKDKLTELLDLKRLDIEKYALKWIEDELYDESIYIDIVNYLEIYNIDIHSTEILSFDTKIVGGDKETCEVRADVEIEIDVAVEVDDEDTGIYDSEDKVMLFREQTNISVSQIINVPILLSFYIVDAEDFDDDFEIIEVNNGKGLELEKTRWH